MVNWFAFCQQGFRDANLWRSKITIPFSFTQLPPSPQWHKSIQFPDYNMGVAQDIIRSLPWITVQIIKIRFVDERLVSDEMSLRVAPKPYYEQENIWILGRR